MVIAAAFLRDIASQVGRPIVDKKCRAADLRLIADCIEGKVKWGKGSEHSFEQRLQINLAAWKVEHRAKDIPVKAALSDQVTALANLFGVDTEAGRKKLRSHIVESRKRQRRQAGLGK